MKLAIILRLAVNSLWRSSFLTGKCPFSFLGHFLVNLFFLDIHAPSFALFTFTFIIFHRRFGCLFVVCKSLDWRIWNEGRKDWLQFLIPTLYNTLQRNHNQMFIQEQIYAHKETGFTFHKFCGGARRQPIFIRRWQRVHRKSILHFE